MKKKVKSLQEIVPKEYVSDPKEQVLSAAVRDFLLYSPEAVGRKMLQQVVSPSIYHLIPDGEAMDVIVMKSVTQGWQRRSSIGFHSVWRKSVGWRMRKG